MNQTKTAGGVIIGPGGKIAVVSQGGKSWSLPKGHIEDGETPERAALREIEEETGLNQLEFIKKLGTYHRHRISLNGGDDKGESKKITLFLYKTQQTELKPIDPHNPEARWLEPNEVADLLTHKKDKEFYTSLLPIISIYTR